MDYEKAYKSIVEKAKNFKDRWKNANAIDSEIALNELNGIFNEIEENEEDTMIDSLIDFVKCFASGYTVITANGSKVSDCIKWLEEQKGKSKLLKELGEYKVKYTQEVLSEYLDEQKKGKCEWTVEDEHNLNVCLSFIPDECLRKWLTDIVKRLYEK